MIEKKQVYKCEVCGNIVESLWDGEPDLVCCGKPMVKLNANTVDAAKEKHVPVVQRNGTKVTVKVGEVAHPMQDDHYILFVELVAGDKVLRHDFKPGDTEATATFLVEEGVDVVAREFCNKHGFWSDK